MFHKVTYIEWGVALGLASMTTLTVIYGMISLFFPNLSTIYYAFKMLLAFYVLYYQIRHFGLKILNRPLFAFILIYLVYIALYLTIFRVLPLDQLEEAPHSLISFVYTYCPLIIYLLSSKTIVSKFDPLKYIIISVLFCTLPSLWYVFFVGVDVFQFSNQVEDISLSLAAIGYSNLPILILSLFYYDKFFKGKWLSAIIALVIVVTTVYILLVNSRRGPIIWGVVIIWICYQYKMGVSFKSNFWAILMIFILFLSINPILEGISSFVPQTAERIELALEGDSSGRLEDDSGSEGVYNSGLSQVAASPIWGSYFRILAFSSRYYAGYPHNIFIEIMMTMGIVGLLPLLFFLLKSLRNLIKLSKTKVKSQYLFCVVLFLCPFFMLQTSGTIVVQVDFWLFFYIISTPSFLRRYQNSEPCKRLAKYGR